MDLVIQIKIKDILGLNTCGTLIHILESDLENYEPFPNEPLKRKVSFSWRIDS